MQQTFLSVALSNLSLFTRSQSSAELLRSINDITGIPIGELLHAERRIQRMGSLAPIRELLTNPTIQRAEKFKYKIGLKQIHKGRQTTREKVASRFLLEISTIRGRLDVEIMIVVKRKMEDAVAARQTAQIQINYTTDQGNQIRTHTQKLNIADIVPVWREPEAAVAAFAA
jgi:hypothetical protein